MTKQVDADRKAKRAEFLQREEAASQRFPPCANPPEFETFLEPEAPPVGIHSLHIRNDDSFYNLIVKVRDYTTDRAVASFFIPPHLSIADETFPDGSYYLQYGFGGKLDISCKNFLTPIWVIQLSMKELRENTQDGHKNWERLEYNFTSALSSGGRRYRSSQQYYHWVSAEDFRKP
ncbi:hypothetical protein [Pleomorphomonas sp. T1.2MG-36]|uniref:hypothetical protein n=1 Tax=Pleomorphomonas sp. T1.2MG-36 TaxID=3041167 RepID=UPI00254232DB|nr:hypothetical protein [Pleomorphomonas sp. T1.2MG-36]